MPGKSGRSKRGRGKKEIGGKWYALYARVSTDLQDIEKQRQTLEEWAKKNNYKYKLYMDPGYSGAVFDRPGLKELMEDIKQGKVEAVVVYKLDRLGRDLREILNFIHFLKENNCKFISISENIDPNTWQGEMFIAMLGMVAQMERNLIRERIKWAMQRIKEKNKGKPKLEQHNLGRPPRGYTSEKGKLRPLTPEEIEERRRKMIEKAMKEGIG